MTRCFIKSKNKVSKNKTNRMKATYFFNIVKIQLLERYNTMKMENVLETSIKNIIHQTNIKI